MKFDVVQGSVLDRVDQSGAAARLDADGRDRRNGNAIVMLSVPANTPTQTGIIRATDLTSGNQITGTFVIQQVTIGGADARRAAAREHHDQRTRQHALLEPASR